VNKETKEDGDEERWERE